MGARSSVTIRDVARRADVSISSVSRVLNESSGVSPEIRHRVQAAIDELGYLPYKSAQILKKKRTGVIGAVIPDVSNPFFSKMVRGMAKAARDADFSVLICDTENRAEIERNHLDVLIQEQVEGVLLTTAERHNTALDQLQERGIPTVAADRRIDDAAIPTVCTDGVADARMLTDYLVELGYGKFAFLAGPDPVSTARERRRGFVQTAERLGIDATVLDSPDAGYTFESGYNAAQALLNGASPLPEVVIAANDLMALGAMRALDEQGHAIPADIGVAGFDGIPLSGWVRPCLTTVEIPAFELGREAMALLLHAVDRGPTAVDSSAPMPTRLVPGESTRRQP
ncbi:MAG: LacI family DNA-binding transcriptional regulator [Candidatus Bipolaricaulia bacterium]